MVSKNTMWNEIFGGKEKGPDYKVMKDMYIKSFFNIASQEGGEDMLRGAKYLQ